MTACACPYPEAIERYQSGALRCGCCGEELRITCPGECGEEHVRAAFKTSKPAPAPRAIAEPKSPAVRICPRCTQPMPKFIGRVPKCCPACRTPAELAQLAVKAAANAAAKARKAAR